MISPTTNLRGKKILVTGARGFVGSRLMSALQEAGADAYALEGDLLSLQKSGVGTPEIVFHLAALTDLAKCRENPALAFEVNVLGTLKLLQALPPVKHFVYVSTLGVYGEPKYLPITEDHPLEPVEPYAASKLAAEALVRGYCTAERIPFSIARLFNVYGPGQRNAFVIPRLLEEILHKDEVSVRSAASTRDFIHIDDVVSGLCAVAEKGVPGTYNIGTGVETSIHALASALVRFTKRKVSLIVQDDTADGGRVKRSMADVTHTKEAVGWMASIRLEEGIQTLLP